jgi:CO/xanthine dehydrogenase FAD-binding subunit
LAQKGGETVITIDFEYYRPGSIQEAVLLFQDLDMQNKNPMYFGGGTEIISMGRMNHLSAGSVIDIKEIPECKLLEFQEDQLVIGAGVTLTQIHESNLFPLLAHAGARVADHTIQNKITLGGNLCGSIIYREAVLPLLLAESELTVAYPGGTKNLPIKQVFDQRMKLNKGEFITQMRTEKRYLSSPYIHVKRTRQDKIHYPLVTICALKAGNEVRTAFSGLCGFPFRSEMMEKELNNHALSIGQKVGNAIAMIPAPVLNNLEGSSEYRSFVLKVLLTSIVAELGE